MRSAMQDLQKETDQTLEALLTPEQVEAYRKLRQERGSRRGGPGERRGRGT